MELGRRRLDDGNGYQTFNGWKKSSASIVDACDSITCTAGTVIIRTGENRFERGAGNIHYRRNKYCCMGNIFILRLDIPAGKNESIQRRFPGEPEDQLYGEKVLVMVIFYSKYLLYTGVKTHWISNLDVAIYSGVMVLIVAGMFAGYVLLKKAKNRILQEDKTPMYVDDDYYWRNGWYANPDDPHLFVQDRFNGMNYTTNLGKPVGVYMTAGVLVGTVILLIWVCIMMLRMDFIPVHLADAGDRFEITSGYTDTEIKKSDLQSVQLLEDGLPDERFNKTNGLADEKHLLGKFEGSETGSCRMYIWLDSQEVIQIKTSKYTIFLNSKDEDQTTEWYELLKQEEQ